MNREYNAHYLYMFGCGTVVQDEFFHQLLLFYIDYCVVC